MEILTPAQPQEVRESIPAEFVEAGITVKNIELLNHLDLKDELMNPVVMEKVDFIGSKVDLAGLQDIDMRLGHDGSIPRIDKIYTYLKLKEQAEKIQGQGELINEQIKRYERS